MFIFPSASKATPKLQNLGALKQKRPDCFWLTVHLWVFKDMYILANIFDDVIMLMYKEINKRQPFFLLLHHFKNNEIKWLPNVRKESAEN